MLSFRSLDGNRWSAEIAARVGGGFGGLLFFPRGPGLPANLSSATLVVDNVVHKFILARLSCSNFVASPQNGKFASRKYSEGFSFFFATISPLPVGIEESSLLCEYIFCELFATDSFVALASLCDSAVGEDSVNASTTNLSCASLAPGVSGANRNCIYAKLDLNLLIKPTTIKEIIILVLSSIGRMESLKRGCHRDRGEQRRGQGPCSSRSPPPHRLTSWDSVCLQLYPVINSLKSHPMPPTIHR